MLLSRLEQQEGEKNETVFFLQDTNAVFTMTAVDSLGFESRAPEETQEQGACRYLTECQVMSSSQILLAFPLKASVVVLDKKE